MKSYMEKLKMESVSIAEDSLNKIAELFPKRSH